MKLLKAFEAKFEPLLDRSSFSRRVLKHFMIASLAIAISLGVGVIGYREFEGMSWIDALLNASMILGGMGPVDVLHTAGGKLFASIYALFSGLVVLAVMGVLLAPFAHRLMHTFHIDDNDAN